MSQSFTFLALSNNGYLFSYWLTGSLWKVYLGKWNPCVKDLNLCSRFIISLFSTRKKWISSFAGLLK